METLNFGKMVSSSELQAVNPINTGTITPGKAPCLGKAKMVEIDVQQL